VSRRRFFRSGHAHEDIADLLAALEPKGRCLDLPAGRGVNIEGIRRAGFVPVAGDLYPELIPHEDVEKSRIDFTKPLPFGDGAFAAILCSEGIEHCPDHLALLREFRRVLEPGGTLILTTPNVLSLRCRLHSMLTGHYSPSRSMLTERTGVTGRTSGKTCFGHVFLPSYLTLRVLLRSLGFDGLRVTTAKYSASAILLAPLLWLPVRLATAWKFRTRRMRRHPDIIREMTSHLMSADLLFGKKLILLAEKTVDDAEDQESS